jgi:hypothetical protein
MLILLNRPNLYPFFTQVSILLFIPLFFYFLLILSWFHLIYRVFIILYLF